MGIITLFLNQDLDIKVVKETITIIKAIKTDNLSFSFKNLGNCFICCQVGILLLLNLNNNFLLGSFSEYTLLNIIFKYFFIWGEIILKILLDFLPIKNKKFLIFE